jgi:hypothetical protein
MKAPTSVYGFIDGLLYRVSGISKASIYVYSWVAVEILPSYRFQMMRSSSDALSAGTPVTSCLPY